MPDRQGGGLRRWWPKSIQIPKEAQREADRRAGESLVSLLDQAGKTEVETLLAHGEYVHGVRRVRELTGLRLIDARRVVDSLRR